MCLGAEAVGRFALGQVADGAFPLTVAPGLLTNAQTFFDHLLEQQGGPKYIQPNLHIDPDVFFTHFVQVGAAPQAKVWAGGLPFIASMGALTAR